jgi:hypothetical protein
MKAFREPPRLADRCTLYFTDAVEAVVARGLARLPEARYETAGAFVQALERAVDPAAARRASAPTVPQVRPSPVPPRMTQSSELPAGSSGELEFELEAVPRPPAAAGHTAVEQMATELTPRPSAPQPADAIGMSTAEDVQHVRASEQRSRRNLLALLSGGALLLAGITYAAVRTAEPSTPEVSRETVRTPERAQMDRPGARGAEQEQNAAEPSDAPPAQAAAPAVEPAAVPAGSEPIPQAAAESARSAPPERAVAASRTPATRSRAARAPSPAAVDRDTPSPSAPAVAVLAPAPAPAAPTADALNKQAGQELLQGHLARAAELYAQATVRDPRSAPAWRGLGLTSERLGRTREAIRAYRRALELAPTGPQADSVRERLKQLE